VAELELVKTTEARIRRLFVDPLGAHVLVIIQTGTVLETFYLDGGWKRARPLSKLKGVHVTSVAWGTQLHQDSLRCVVRGACMHEGLCRQHSVFASGHCV
jgi:hypothetical protein